MPSRSGRYSCWTPRSLCLCWLLSPASTQPTFTSVAPAERPITIRPIGRREPVARACVKSPGLLVLGIGLFLFQLANASILPLAGEALIYQGDSHSSLIVSTLIVLPQIIVAPMAPWAGRQAKSWGRRPLLLIGFGALPIRALLFASVTDPSLLLCLQVLDGISGAVLGVLTALVAADLTSGSGRFNLAQGIVGTASGIGASLSTTLFGLI